MLVIFEHLIEGNIDSPKFGKTLTMEVCDSTAMEIEKRIAIGKRAAEFATIINNAL